MNDAVSETVQRVATFKNGISHQAQIGVGKGTGNDGSPVVILWCNACSHLVVPYLVNSYPGESNRRIAGNDAIEIKWKTLSGYQDWLGGF